MRLELSTALHLQVCVHLGNISVCDRYVLLCSSMYLQFRHGSSADKLISSSAEIEVHALVHLLTSIIRSLKTALPCLLWLIDNILLFSSSLTRAAAKLAAIPVTLFSFGCRENLDLGLVMPRRESLAPIELKQTQEPPRRQSLVPKPVKKTPVVRHAHNSADSPVRAPVRAVAASAAVTTPTRSGEAVEPPAEIRCIVDKTAEFVAQNGLEFEQRILSNEKRNPKFNFLKSKDAYHSYYQRRILDFIDQGSSPEVAKNQPANTSGVAE